MGMAGTGTTKVRTPISTGTTGTTTTTEHSYRGSGEPHKVPPARLHIRLLPAAGVDTYSPPPRGGWGDSDRPPDDFSRPVEPHDDVASKAVDWVSRPREAARTSRRFQHSVGPSADPDVEGTGECHNAVHDPTRVPAPSQARAVARGVPPSLA